MPNSQQLYGELQGLQGQMQGLTGQMQQYTPVQSQDIYNELLNRVDNFKPLYEAQRGFETQAYAEPAKAMADYYGQYGQDPSQGRSAMTQLQGILQNVGRLYGSADTMNDVINQRGGQLQQLAGTTLDQYNSARANLQDQIAQTQNLYNNKQGMYNTALQLEEQARQRAEAERARQQQLALQRQQQAAQQRTPVGQKDRTGKTVIGYDGNGNPVYREDQKTTLQKTTQNVLQGVSNAINTPKNAFDYARVATNQFGNAGVNLIGQGVQKLNNPTVSNLYNQYAKPMLDQKVRTEAANAGTMSDIFNWLTGKR